MKSILIIDDEKSICESIQMILDYEGYEVEFSTSALQGIEMLITKNYSALLLDIQMPEMSGFEVLKRAKEIDLALSVIIISANGRVVNAL